MSQCEEHEVDGPRMIPPSSPQNGGDITGDGHRRPGVVGPSLCGSLQVKGFGGNAVQFAPSLCYIYFPFLPLTHVLPSLLHLVAMFPQLGAILTETASM